MNKAKVFFSKNITTESLTKLYKALGVKLTGKVGVKVSTGEDGAKGYLKADLIGPFVKSFNGTIIECNTAYQAPQRLKNVSIVASVAKFYRTPKDLDSVRESIN